MKKVIKEYIKEGYNPYPLMRMMSKQYKVDEKWLNENKQDLELKTNIEISQTHNLDSQRILQSLENYSPYKPIFNISEKLGSLISQQKEKMKQENYDGMEELDEEIDKTKEMLRNRLKKSNFDLEELMDIMAGKRAYIKESEDGFDYRSLNYDMYVGLQEAKNVIGFELKRQEQLGVYNI